MGYTGFSRKEFFGSFLTLGPLKPGRKAASEAMRERRSVHRASLTWILIFCNRLPPRPFPPAASILGNSARAKLNRLDRVRTKQTNSLASPRSALRKYRSFDSGARMNDDNNFKSQKRVARYSLVVQPKFLNISQHMC